MRKAWGFCNAGKKIGNLKTKYLFRYKSIYVAFGQILIYGSNYIARTISKLEGKAWKEIHSRSLGVFPDVYVKDHVLHYIATAK